MSRQLLLIAGLGALAFNAGAQEAREVEVQSLSDDSQSVYDFASHTWSAKKGVIVTQGAITLVADEARGSELTGQVVAEGNVVLRSGEFYWKGDHLEYNFNTHEIGAGSYRAGLSGVFVSGENLSGASTNKTFEVSNATFTTDDLQNPGYRVRARKIKIIDGKEIEADGATLYVGNVPLFYLPHYRRNLESHANYFVVTPGYRSTFGPYLLTEYHVGIATNFDAGLRLDIRAKRGPGTGPDINYDLGKYGAGHADYYFTQDWEAKTDPRLVGFHEDRQRVRFSHTVQLQTNFTAKANINWQSDPQVLRDFFEGEYRTNAQPKTLFEVSKFWSNFSLDVEAEPQLNYFFPTIERLPDIKLSALRQQLGVSPFYYEGESSFAYLRAQGAGLPGFTNYAAMRADTYHQLVLPRTFFGFLNVTPRAGARLSHYGDTESPLLPFQEEDRFVFNTGVETSFKASRLFPSARSQILDLTELRHIIEPSINYVYVPRPNVRPNRLPQFDTELPSLSLLPIDFPDYNTIDSIDSQNVMRLGVRNKLQTKRDGAVDTLLNWYFVTDWRLDPRAGQTTFSDIYSDFDFKPQRWLLLNSEIRFNINDGHLNLSTHTVSFTPSDVWSEQIGHHYVRGTPLFGPNSANNTFFNRFYYRFNENWGARMSHHFEARDGTLEEQYYTVYRDFRSFTGALTFRVRDNRSGPLDYAVAFSISLKSRPTMGGKDRIEPAFLIGN
jgi:LPS-assembly protein